MLRAGRSAPHGINNQNGIALLILVIALALTITTYYFASISLVDYQVNNLEQTRSALKKAKQALINYAVMHADGSGSGNPGEFGYLPCPHIANATEGVQDLTCKARYKNTVGYLPWISLETDILRDATGNCLWYAVSGSYKNNPDSLLINEDTNGMFQTVDDNGAIIFGNSPEDRIVAVVFAAGAPVAGQNRTYDPTKACGGDAANVAEYLEGDGVTDNSAIQDIVDTIDQFISASITSDSAATPYNDLMITISREEIWAAVMARNDINGKMQILTHALAQCLSNYAAKNGFNRLPWPADVALADYRLENNYDDMDGTSGYAGRYPFIVTGSNAVIGVGGNDVIFTEGACTTAGGIIADLDVVGSEYRHLWDNWKDHFFYVVSKGFEPDASVASCGTCITVDGNPMAAVVIYAGSRQGVQSRTGPVGVDAPTKNNIANYIENGNEANFPDLTGNGNYVTGGNDIMYCIDDSMVVAIC